MLKIPRSQETAQLPPCERSARFGSINHVILISMEFQPPLLMVQLFKLRVRGGVGGGGGGGGTDSCLVA